MCLIAFAIGASSRWPLLIAANRDEFFDRPAAALMRWQTPAGHNIISGRDLRAGGAWLGLTPHGRVAMLTNVRELPAAGGEAAAQQSRGELVMHWLEADINAEQFMAQTDSAAYSGFNLVLGDLQTGNWNWLSNRSFDSLATGAAAHRPTHAGWTSKNLPPGIYGLSNAALNTAWPKTLALKTALAEALKTPDETVLKAKLWAALASRTKARTEDLPDTGLPMALEAVLSSAFIHEAARGQAGYGTRCSTLVLASPAEKNSACWTVKVEEKTHQQSDLSLAASTTSIQWKLDLPADNSYGKA